MTDLEMAMNNADVQIADQKPVYFESRGVYPGANVRKGRKTRVFGPRLARCSHLPKPSTVHSSCGAGQPWRFKPEYVLPANNAVLLVRLFTVIENG